MTEEYFIPQPPKEIFLHSTDKLEEIKNEHPTTFVIDHIDYSDGIKVFMVGAKYPRKGFPTEEAIWCCNIIKRMFVMMLRFPLLLVFVNKAKLLQYFTEIGYKVMKQHLLKLHMMTPVAKEIHYIIKTFLVAMGFNKELAYKTAVILSHLVEYDDAYRYRIQDLITESSKEALLFTPRKEIKRLMNIYRERQGGDDMVDKFGRFARLMSLLISIPKVKTAYDITVRMANIDNLKRDAADEYWTLNQSGYKFMGKTFEERFATMEPKPQGFKFTYE